MSASASEHKDDLSLRCIIIEDEPDPDGRFFVFLAVFRHYRESTIPKFKKGFIDTLSADEILDLVDDPSIVF